MKKTVLISTLMASVAFASNALAGGSCGDSCTWDLTDGVLTISGTGPMTDFSYLNTPWEDQIDSITSVQVSNGITSIADFAFSEATSLTSINIPDSVTSIGEGAFRSTSLTSVTIPEGVTSIGAGAFYKATSLTSVTIPEGVTSIGNGAFYGATSLTSITIPDSVTSIGMSAFSGATSLTSITIPDTAALQVGPSGNGPFAKLDLNNIIIHCAGVLEQCKANMAAAGYADGTYNMVQAPYSKKQADGSRAYYDANGKLTGFTGKRIYTLDEANKITGSQNRVSIKYR